MGIDGWTGLGSLRTRLNEILEDPYVRNRASEREIARLLERPEVIEALGRGTVTEAEQELS